MTNTELTLYIATGSAVCALITAIFPEPKNETGKKIWNLINYFGCNFRHAQNQNKTPVNGNKDGK